MHVPFGWCCGLLEEARPVQVPRLVGADLGRDDRELEWDADLLHRGFDEVAVGVGQDRELPTARTRFLERRPHFWEGLPGGKRLRQAGYFLVGRTELPHRLCHDLPIAPGATGLKGRFDLVVAVEPFVRPVLAEDTYQLTADPAVPVDQRAVAVKRCPADWRHNKEP